MGNTGKDKEPETTGKQKRNNVIETVGIAGIAGITSHNVTARTLESTTETLHTVEVLSQETMMDESGNLVQVTAVLDDEGRESVLLDSNNDGYADLLASDINHDQEISADEISSLEGLEVEMTQPDAEIIHQSLESMTYDSSLPDYVNDADVQLSDLG